ncbi:23S rRNA (adenine(2030)-N(6))-methyltransferase RlmJ [Corallincola holothuriorum]|uniref:Ribosomal RNA large subunit methyltransferase J n=1 Tax=Corallincola holothuriorum TaxID=2282215 RepID=A0A368NPV6_9GAMM|nr:23S rRNA (adenine(2030)-N(6))-methyltransferase RlmJ [Corallincola holothuriorum]RCU51714.1 23S rRNA (adenine(2030)-N(6))-methyltransferase RlmJ [Corallincola holothuriorum]
MLSYRHSFHAGNYADVLKHLVQVRILNYFCQKDKPFCYIDSHAGAGGYELSSGHAQQTQEYQDGIQRLWQIEGLPESLQSYLEEIRAFNGSKELIRYPGSPTIAQQILRRQDKLWLYELHPTDYKILSDHCQEDRRIRCEQSDGFQGLIAKVPPLERRAVVLMDPPYELKEDYQRCITTLIKANRRFATGCYALWYPVVARERINKMEAELVASGIRNIQLFELGQSKDTETFGMTAAGMIIINPPWTLMQEMQQCLPLLAELLGKEGRGHFRCETLVEE